MKYVRRVLLGLAAAAAVMFAGVAAFIYSGAYDTSAIDQHTPPVYWLIEYTMQRSVAVRAREDETPDLTHADKIERGFKLYHANCLQCHGAPGIPPDRGALGMTPVPAFLVPTAREWSAAKLQWVIKNGIKMTGMPAWKYRMSDDEIWQVVAFLKQKLPYVSAEQYRALAANIVPDKAPEAPRAAGAAPASGSPQAGRRAIEQYACATCHVIPGITGATRHVGPPLQGISRRNFIGGVLANTPENMVRWLMSPPAVSPLTAMPDLGVREQDARDIGAYLDTLD